MTATEPQIDFTAIEFLSDRLTIKMLRKAWPDCFDIDYKAVVGKAREFGHGPGRRPFDDNLGVCLIDAERILAERAFNEAMGRSVKDDGHLANWEIIEDLVPTYIELGLARGEHEATAMIRQIQERAAAQAHKFRGQSR